MSTFFEVQTRINNDFLNRTDFDAETKRAIRASIRHYERQRWIFNETSTALTTSAGQAYVDIPSNFLILDDLRITLNNDDIPLIQRDPQWLRNANAAHTTGQPTDYAIYQNRFQFFPQPDSAYSLPIYYLKSLTELSADGDTNAWLEGVMEDVIVYHAAKIMWATVVRNDAEAMKCAALEKEALSTALSHREQFYFTSLRATSF